MTCFQKLHEQLRKSFQQQSPWAHAGKGEQNDLFFNNMIPESTHDVSQSIDLMNLYQNKTINYTVPGERSSWFTVSGSGVAEK
ncbi:MAG: hypothetical protein U5R06_07535 [candidate division KSB1 bacterium]|nr:hypothetical protein [candidate division KSB1 bacterium]